LSYVNQEERSEFYSLEVIADKVQNFFMIYAFFIIILIYFVYFIKTSQTEQINKFELGSLAYDVADYKVAVLYYSKISDWLV
jgi:hypothetical protein